ncbi:hypothetical protein MNBD_DELTA03-1026 [hydrothermal vent metagenome]|uniref:DUF3373 domain-containing protein n=1 Tax=hydrothermal vent metagenome TaxID=652676 RepID=A0A3B0VEN9_9ZZZZ
MKKYLLLPALLLAWAGTAVAAQNTVTIPAEDYHAIISQLKALQQRVNVLEHRSPTNKAESAAIPSKVTNDINDIYDTLDKVETKTLQDKINLGAELRTRVDNFTVKNHLYFSTGSQGVKESNDNSWTNRFRLNMDAKIRKNLKFTGRLTAYKFFAGSNSPDSAVFGDYDSAHIPSGTNIKLDRAYVDWIPSGMPVPLAFTFGRHPSSEGPPFELKENRKRQSTYPALLFDGEADGIVATIGLQRYTGWKNSALRFAYGKGYQDKDSVNAYLDAPGGLNDTDVFATFFETEIPGVNNSLLVLSALRANDMAVDFSNSNIPYLKGQSKNVGDLDLYGIHVQADKVMSSNFDVFMSLGLNHTHPNGQYLTYGPRKLGLLNNDGTSSHTGWALYTGLRYTITSARFNNPKVGFEYNHGSEYWFSFTSGPAELYNKLATRGNAYDFYYIQPFNKNLFARLGYTYVNYQYSLTAFPVGDFGKSQEELRNAYMLLDCHF